MHQPCRTINYTEKCHQMQNSVLNTSYQNLWHPCRSALVPWSTLLKQPSGWPKTLNSLLITKPYKGTYQPTVDKRGHSVWWLNEIFYINHRRKYFWLLARNHKYRTVSKNIYHLSSRSGFHSAAKWSNNGDWHTPDLVLIHYNVFSTSLQVKWQLHSRTTIWGEESEWGRAPTELRRWEQGAWGLQKYPIVLFHHHPRLFNSANLRLKSSSETVEAVSLTGTW
jgi:hypothetical protein